MLRTLCNEFHAIKSMGHSRGILREAALGSHSVRGHKHHAQDPGYVINIAEKLTIQFNNKPFDQALFGGLECT
jgi:hypothetical protein